MLGKTQSVVNVHSVDHFWLIFLFFFIRAHIEYNEHAEIQWLIKLICWEKVIIYFTKEQFNWTKDFLFLTYTNETNENNQILNVFLTSKLRYSFEKVTIILEVFYILYESNYIIWFLLTKNFRAFNVPTNIWFFW